MKNLIKFSEKINLFSNMQTSNAENSSNDASNSQSTSVKEILE